MSIDDFLLLAALQIVVLGLPAIALAWILRRAGAPGGASGAAIAGGIIAGLFLGPGVFGSAWPEWHDPLFLGGVDESHALRVLQQQHARELTAMRGADVSTVAMDELLARQRGEAAPLVDALNQARTRHRAQLDSLGLAPAALVLLCASTSIIPRRSAAALRHPGRSSLTGILALTLSVSVPMLLWRWITRESWDSSLALGVLLGAPAVSALLRPPLWLAASIGSLGAIALTTRVASPLALTSLASALMLGVIVSLASARGMIRRWSRAILFIVILPLACAMLAVRFDLRLLASDPTTRWAFWWGMVIALVWCSDGRMVGWMIAMSLTRTLPRSQRRWTPAARLVNTGTDVFTVALALIFAQASSVSEPALVSALWAAALLAVTPSMRLVVARWLDSVSARPGRS